MYIEIQEDSNGAKQTKGYINFYILNFPSEKIEEIFSHDELMNLTVWLVVDLKQNASPINQIYQWESIF